VNRGNPLGEEETSVTPQAVASFVSAGLARRPRVYGGLPEEPSRARWSRNQRLMQVLTQITVTTVTGARFAGHFGVPAEMR
jgi:hypothetical protein